MSFMIHSLYCWGKNLRSVHWAENWVIPSASLAMVVKKKTFALLQTKY